MQGFDRRRVLRGMLGGSAVTVGVPLLNVFLNGNGTALADGKPMPVLIMLHGLGGAATGARFTFPLAEELGVKLLHDCAMAAA